MDTYTAIHVFIKLVIGGFNYLFCKITLDAYKNRAGLGKDDYALKNKPAMMTISTFLSLFMVAIPIYIHEIRKSSNKGYSLSLHGVLAIAGSLEMIAVYLSMFGNTILPASILVFFKATRVLWSALLSKYVLKRRLYMYHWVAVAMTFIGLVPIGIVQAYVGKKKDSSMAWQCVAFGMVFLCEFFRAVRIIIEERLMKEKGVSPGFVQFVEGYSGLILAITLAFVLHTAGAENLVDSISTLSVDGHWHIALWLSIHTVCHGLVNYSSTVVTKLLSSVHNAIISEMRILVVWLPEFIIFWIGLENYGKEWSFLCLLDLPGFAIIVASAFIYSGTLRLPFPFLYPAAQDEKVVSPSTNDGHAHEHCDHKHAETA